MKKCLLVVFLLYGAALAQTKTQPALSQFLGTYGGTWHSPYGSGVAVLSIDSDSNDLKGRILIIGSPVGYKGDDLVITAQNFADDILTIKFKAKHGRLTGSGIFQKGTFVGDYRFRYMLAVDRGQWHLEKDATASASPPAASH